METGLDWKGLVFKQDNYSNLVLSSLQGITFSAEADQRTAPTKLIAVPSNQKWIEESLVLENRNATAMGQK